MSMSPSLSARIPSAAASSVHTAIVYRDRRRRRAIHGRARSIALSDPPPPGCVPRSPAVSSCRASTRPSQASGREAGQAVQGSVNMDQPKCHCHSAGLGVMCLCREVQQRIVSTSSGCQEPHKSTTHGARTRCLFLFLFLHVLTFQIEQSPRLRACVRAREYLRTTWHSSYGAEWWQMNDRSWSPAPCSVMHPAFMPDWWHGTRAGCRRPRA